MYLFSQANILNKRIPFYLNPVPAIIDCKTNENQASWGKLTVCRNQTIIKLLQHIIISSCILNTFLSPTLVFVRKHVTVN